MNCRLCNGIISPIGKCVIMNKYEVGYFCCSDCGSVMTEPPYWLKEVYDGFVDDINVGSRAASNTRVISAFCKENIKNKPRVLDYGCGAGLLVKNLLASDIDAFGYDKYRKDDPKLLNEKWDVVSAFEVFEHFERPLEEFLSLSSSSDAIIISTELVPPGPPQPPQGWHYYACWCGQHIFFYTLRAFGIMANRAGFPYLYSTGLNYHIFSRTDIKTGDITRAVPSLSFQRVS